MATFERHTDVSDFEDDDEELVVSNEPYLYEPEYTDEELREHLERWMAPHSLSVACGPLDCRVCSPSICNAMQ